MTRAFAIALSTQVALAIGACGDDPVEPEFFVTGSSTIVLDDAEATLWLTSPDDDRVIQLDADTLDELQQVLALRARGAAPS